MMDNQQEEDSQMSNSFEEDRGAGIIGGKRQSGEMSNGEKNFDRFAGNIAQSDEDYDDEEDSYQASIQEDPSRDQKEVPQDEQKAR